MPMYDYRCNECNLVFSELQNFDDPLPECPECESEDVKRLITTAPTFARGMLTHAGDGRNATKEELRRKWREETPKLRKKLRDKYGDKAVENVPSLNMTIKDE